MSRLKGAINDCYGAAVTPSAEFVLHFSGSGVHELATTARGRLQHTDGSDHVERARLHATVAAATVFTDPAEAQQAAAAAAEEAHLAGSSPVARAWALTAACVVDLSCEATHDRLEMTREVLRIAQQAGESGPVEVAYFLHLAALAELGRMNELDQALSPVGPILLHFPSMTDGRHVAWFRCLQATLDGQLRLAEELAEKALAIAHDSADPDALTVYIGQLAIIRWAQGRVVELEPAFLQARQDAPHEPIWAVSLAWMWLRQGRTSAARALVSSLPPVPELPVDRNWLATACLLADVASELGRVDLTQQLYDALLPFESRLVTIGLGVTCWGTVARSLALAAAARADIEAAIAHYRTAIEVAGRSGAHPWLAEAQWELAELLAQHARAGDHDEAVALASEALATGRALHLHGIEAGASVVLAALQGPQLPGTSALVAPELAPGSAGGATSRPAITVFDGFSVTGVDGTVARWQSRKARQLLKILVARRGTSVSREALMDTLWPDVEPARLMNRFSVAVTAIRKAFDPNGAHPRDAFVEHRDGLLRLRVEALDIDVERFLSDARASLESAGPPASRIDQLTAALDLYTGEPLLEEQEELWATELRREAHLAYFSVAHTLAELLAQAGDHLSRLETYRRILSLDEYDQRAHEGVIDALEHLGSHGHAEAARRDYHQKMAALGVPYNSAI